MTAYPLEKLLTVRCHRENRARNHLAQSREKLCLAEIQKRQKERELLEYRHWRQVEERRLFEKLRSGPAAVQELMSYANVVAALRATEAGKAEEVEGASLQVIKAEEELVAARRRYAEVCRQKMKIEEHKAFWGAEQLQLMERLAENEMEELAKPQLMP